MDKLQLGFYIRGKWELEHGNIEAATAAFKTLGEHPLAIAAIAEIRVAQTDSMEDIVSIYLDAAEAGAVQFLPVAGSLITILNPNDERLPKLAQRIAAELEADNPLVVRGAFMERISSGDFSNAAWMCSKAIQLRDPQSMSKLAAILMNPSGYEEFVYYLSDREIFNPQNWPVPIAVHIPDSKLFDSDGFIHQDENLLDEGFSQDMDARQRYENFVNSLLDQGDEGPLYQAGRLSAIFEIIQDNFWSVHKMNEFARNTEDSQSFWGDPDLILFYTSNLITTFLHYQVEWMRNGISQYGLEDLFDRTIELAVTSDTRKETERNNSYRKMRPTISQANRELSIYEAFEDAAVGSSVSSEKIRENRYCKHFDDGNLLDLLAQIRSDTTLAVQGAESYFDGLCIFLVLGNNFAQQGFHEYITPALAIIEEADDADETFLNLLSQLWLEVGHKGFDDPIYPGYRLPDLLSKKIKVNEEYREAISLYFPLARAVENLHLAVDDLLEELESGVNVVGKLSAALHGLLSDETAPLNDDIWWDEEVRYSFLDPFELHDNLWTTEIFDLAAAIDSVDKRYICNLIEIDSGRGTPFFKKNDLEKLIQDRWCDDDECDGLEEMAAGHPNFQ